MGSAEKSVDVRLDSVECEQKIDRINDLPEEIRHRILALLPTKSAVAATVVSTKWITLDFKLDLDDTLIFKRKEKISEYRLRTSFKQFVNRVFLRDVASISELRLRVGHRYTDSEIDLCVRAAINLNVRKLSVMINGIWNSFNVGSLQGSKTITSLKLGGFNGNCRDLIVGKDFCLPNLKKLCLKWINLSNNEHIEDFLKGCPQLARLSIYRMDFESLGTLSICSSLLEYLKISGNVDIEFTIIELDVPKLKIFVYDDNLAKNYVIKSSMSLFE